MGKKLLAGLAGSVVLTLVHELTRKIDPKAPRMDLLGMQALEKLLKAVGIKVPQKRNLFGYTMLADIVGNALYYGFTGASTSGKILSRSTMAGVSAGIGAVRLPKLIGLNGTHSNKTVETQWLTVLLYTIGGLAAGATMKLLQNKA